MEEPFVFGANGRRWKYIAPLLVSAGAGVALGLALLVLLVYRTPTLPGLPPPSLPTRTAVSKEPHASLASHPLHVGPSRIPFHPIAVGGSRA
jgi:hypothetical protein